VRVGAAEGSGPYPATTPRRRLSTEAITHGGLQAVPGDYATEAITRGGLRAVPENYAKDATSHGGDYPRRAPAVPGDYATGLCI
jgi:hypothetical protein